jgi:hypothetical protein
LHLKNLILRRGNSFEHAFYHSVEDAIHLVGYPDFIRSTPMIPPPESSAALRRGRSQMTSGKKVINWKQLLQSVTLSAFALASIAGTVVTAQADSSSSGYHASYDGDRSNDYHHDSDYHHGDSHDSDHHDNDSHDSDHHDSDHRYGDHDYRSDHRDYDHHDNDRNRYDHHDYDHHDNDRNDYRYNNRYDNRYNNRYDGRYNNGYGDYGYGGYGNGYGNEVDFSGVVVDRDKRSNTVRVRANNGRTYTIYTRKADNLDRGDRVRVRGQVRNGVIYADQLNRR